MVGDVPLPSFCSCSCSW